MVAQQGCPAPPQAAHMLLLPHTCPEPHPMHGTVVPQLLTTLPHFPAQVVRAGSLWHAHLWLALQVLGREQSLFVQQSPVAMQEFPHGLKPEAQP
jgi:hypothetical protein